jgi:hypothetical protein
MLKVGAVIVGVALLAALVGPAITPFDPASQQLALRLAARRCRIPSVWTNSDATSLPASSPVRGSRSWSD